MKKMINIIILLCVCLALKGGYAAILSKNADISNDIENGGSYNNIPSEDIMKPVLHIFRKPPPVLYHIQGQTLEITCEALATPVPSINWFKNNKPIIGSSFNPVQNELQTNEILFTSEIRMARLKSSILIDEGSEDKDVYTCVMHSGNKVEIATTTVFTVDDTSNILTDIQKTVKPRILLNYASYMDVSGNGAMLPCKVNSHSNSFITWRDNNKAVITRHNHRMKVLKNGELIIKNLRWSDMGEYTCTAENGFGKTKISTFLYPFKAG